MEIPINVGLHRSIILFFFCSVALLLLLLSSLSSSSIWIVGGLQFVVDVVRTIRTILLWFTGCYEMLYGATVEHEDNWKHIIINRKRIMYTSVLLKIHE